MIKNIKLIKYLENKSSIIYLAIKTKFSNSSNNHEREFLPAALEILETPASPAGRSLAAIIILFFSLALLWAFIGEVDVNAVAQGQLLPEGGVKAIQPFESGIVRKINVTNGQHVVAGQILIELDSTESQVDLSQLTRQQELAELDVARLQTTLDNLEGNTKRNIAMASTANDASKNYGTNIGSQSFNQNLRLNEQLSAYQARGEILQSQLAEMRSMLTASRLEQDKLTAQLPVITEKAKAWKSLAEQNMGARIQSLEIENERVNVSKNLAIEQQKTTQYLSSINRLQAELTQYRADSRKQLLTELVDSQDKAHEAKLSIKRYKEREQYRFLRAPVAGYVQQLSIHTIGGVVQPAQQLLVIAPDNATLFVEAKVLDEDIGFVHPGQHVTLKIDSYPYSKYGTLSGEVEHLSQDAILDEKLGPVYAAKIRLPKEAKSKTGIRLPLQAGMGLTAEITTDRRRVIDYLLSPIKEVFSEAIRER